MSYTPGRIRGQINVAKPRETWVDKLTNETPEAWKGFALEMQMAFFISDTELMDFSGFTAVTVEIHDNEYKSRPAVATAICTDFNDALTVENWNSQAGYHCKANFSESDMALDLGAASVNTSKTFWVFVHGIDGSGNRKPLGGTTLRIFESGVSTVAAGPNQGANLIPGGAVYDGSGNYAVAVQIDKRYEWTDGGANDTSIVNGTDTYTTSQVFTAQGSSVTLKGTAGAAVTALLRYPLYPTIDELYSAIENSNRLPKKFDRYVNGNYERIVGIDADGTRIDQVNELT